MSSELVDVNIEEFIEVTDYVANGSFASLKENVNYVENNGYAILIRLVDFNNGWNGDFRFVDKISYEFLGKSSVVPGDIVISNVGANAGTVFKVPDLGKPMTLGPNSVLLKPREDSQEIKDYLYYYFSSPKGQHLLSSITAGSAQPKFNKTDLRSRNIPIPADGNYKEIISPLLSLDKKIHLNQQTNETLEAMAQAIFKSWFVDFDPVRAKIEAKSAGRDPNRSAIAAISACTKVSADGAVLWEETEAALDHKLTRMSEAQKEQLYRTAQLFPDELVESEIGEVPKGWDFGNLGEICSVQGGYAFKSKLFKEEGYPVVKIKNINEDYTVDLKNGQFLSAKDSIDKETYELIDGDYVLAMTGATVGKRGIIVSNSEKVMLNQRVAKFESEQFKGNINWFIHSAFLATNLKDQIVNIARGSAQPNISASGIESAELIIPSNSIIEEFLNIADPLFKKWIANYKQNEILSSLRATLLPKLISGEVEV